MDGSRIQPHLAYDVTARRWTTKRIKKRNDRLRNTSMKGLPETLGKELRRPHLQDATKRGKTRAYLGSVKDQGCHTAGMIRDRGKGLNRLQKTR